VSVHTLIKRQGTTLTHQRRVSERDRVGAQTNRWQTLASDVPCWVQPASVQLRLAAAQAQTRITDVVYTARDLGARAGDRLLVGDRVLLVHGQRDVAGQGRLSAIDCEEVAS